MQNTGRVLLLAGLVLLFAASSCALPGLNMVSTPTPTGTIIVAREAQTPEAAAEVTPDPDASCLNNPRGVLNVGQPCILGTYAAHYNILQQPNDHDTIVTDSLLQADVKLWAVSPGKLQGSAHLGYSLNSKQQDPQSDTCTTVTGLVAPFSWDVSLEGQYSPQPDGNIGFIVQADPPRGPEYFTLFPDCPAVPTVHEEGVTWSGLGGTLTQGAFHSVTDTPVPSDATGRFYVEVQLNVVK